MWLVAIIQHQLTHLLQATEVMEELVWTARNCQMMEVEMHHLTTGPARGAAQPEDEEGTMVSHLEVTDEQKQRQETYPIQETLQAQRSIQQQTATILTPTRLQREATGEIHPSPQDRWHQI
jgi:hypothetical protein